MHAYYLWNRNRFYTWHCFCCLSTTCYSQWHLRFNKMQYVLKRFSLKKSVSYLVSFLLKCKSEKKKKPLTLILKSSIIYCWDTVEQYVLSKVYMWLERQIKLMLAQGLDWLKFPFTINAIIYDSSIIFLLWAPYFM